MNHHRSDEWQTMKMTELSESILPGFAEGNKKVQNGLIHLRMNNISTDFRLNFDLLRTISLSDDKLEKYRLLNGDIIFNNTNSQDLVGKSAIFKTEKTCVYSNHLSRIRVRKNIVRPEWVLLYLRKRWLAKDFKRICNKWINQAAIANEKIKNLELPVPSLVLQDKIIQKLIPVISFIDKKQEEYSEIKSHQDTHIENLSDNLILSLVRKNIPIANLPDGWQKKRLSDVCTIQRGRFAHRPRNEPSFFGGKYAFIQTGDITASSGRVAKFKQTLNDKGLAISRMFPKGTVVMTIAANIGHTAILDIDACCTDSIIGIKPLANQALPEYIEYTLRLFRYDLEKRASKNAQKNINYSFLKPLEIPLPDIEEQGAIIRRIEKGARSFEHFHDLTGYMHGLSQRTELNFDNLRLALLEKAFSGSSTV